MTPSAINYNIKMFVIECSSKYSNKMKKDLLSIFYQIISNYSSQRPLNFQSCFIISSQSLLHVVIIRTTGSFPLLEHLSSELQVLIHVEGQLKRVTPSTIR